MKDRKILDYLLACGGILSKTNDGNKALIQVGEEVIAEVERLGEVLRLKQHLLDDQSRIIDDCFKMLSEREQSLSNITAICDRLLNGDDGQTEQAMKDIREWLEPSEKKPHRGRIDNWRKMTVKGDQSTTLTSLSGGNARTPAFFITGNFVDHPKFAGKFGHTSLVVKHDLDKNEIETLNSRYTLLTENA